MKISALNLPTAKLYPAVRLYKILPTGVIIFLLLIGGIGKSWGQFIPGNIIVEQIGDGTTALGSGATKVKLLHFNTNGTIPSFASTAFFGFTGTPTSSPYNIVESGSATSNGYISLSVDKSFIVVPGYNAPNGQASIAGSSAATFGRTIGKALPNGNINANGTFNTLTNNNYRSIVSTGSEYWLAGAAGVVYTNTDVTTGIATTATSISTVNTRILNIFNNTLCYSTGSGTIGIYYLGTFNTLPTSTASATLIFATGAGSGTYGFALSPGGLICYVADDRASALGGIQKWTYSGTFSTSTGWSGGTWSLSYTLGTGVASIGARGVTVDFSGSNPIIYATTAETPLNRFISITDAGAGSPATTLATATANFIFRGIAFAPDNTWLGGGTTDWSTPANWSSGVVPTGSDNAIIPTGNTPYPVLSVSAAVKDLYIQTGAAVTIGGNNTITINGAITGSGTLSGSATSNLIIGGTALNQTLNFTTGSRVLKDLTLSSGATATLGTALEITAGSVPATNGTVIVNSGATLNTGGNLTLKSDPNGTARVGTSAGTISGNVTVERWIKLRAGGTGRAYRLLAPTVNTSGSIRANWMEGGMNIAPGTNDNPVPLFGTQITGAGGNANEFDVTTNNAASLYSTTNAVTPTYTAIGSTTGTLNALTGYFLYIRGDRSMNMTLPLAPGMPTSSTTLRTKGTLLTGDQSFTGTLLTGDGNMNLVTNPYASPISWTAVYADGVPNPNPNTNLKNYYTYWDANLGTRGGFVTVTNAGVVTPAPVGGVPAATVDIQPGQAFFVTSDGASAPTLTIKEAHKSTGNNNGVFLVPPESFSVNLLFNEPNNYRRMADGVSALYDNTYTPGLDGNDAFEINNWDENIAIAREGKHLAIEGRPVIITRDTLPLFMNNMKQQAYEFEFTPAQFTNIGLKAELIDNFLNTRSLLSVTTTTVVAFTITTDPASFASNRFMVVFGPLAPLAIDVLTIRAQAKNNGVQVDWTARTEKDMDRYELERSFNGTSFSRINTTTAVGNSPVAVNYGWLDANPQTGINFYRIKAIDKSGQVKYTDMVKVNFGKTNPGITVYPNPVNGNSFNLQLTDMEKGIYSLAIFNNLGQMVYRTTVNHAGGSASVPVTPVTALVKGVYEVVLTGENTRITTAITKN